MNTKFYIIEDDIVTQDTLKKVIHQNELGEVIGTADNGVTALDQIKWLHPNIVLVDLLLPKLDGIGIVTEIRKQMPSVHFIMISQVTSSEMIAKAYQEGIEFFISKPINLIEVVSIIEKVTEKIQMSQVIESFENAFRSIDLYKKPQVGSVRQEHSERASVESVLSQLGISGDSGTSDIAEILLYLMKKEAAGERFPKDYKMSELYQYLCDYYMEQYGKQTNVFAVEQRIRRAIFKALDHIANIGIEDYGHEAFSRFSGTLFEFKEVRAQMDYIRGKSYEKGKISVRKFIEGLMVAIKEVRNY